MARRRFDPLTVFGVPLTGGGLIPTVGQAWYVDPNADVFVPKKANGTGRTDLAPFATLEEALAACNTGDRIYITGNIREEGLIASNLKFDVQIIGVGSRHHPDQPSSAYHPGSAMIRPPASPTAATPLLTIRGRGWQLHNVMFDCPVDAAAVQLINNAGSGTSEYDASHATFKDVDFISGKYGIQDVGGAGHVHVIDCEFTNLLETGGCGIINTSTAAGLPYRWLIKGMRCPSAATTEGNKGNQSHIDAPFASAIIRDSVFGTVESTGLYIDLTGGQDNMVAYNVLAGAYTTADYVSGTGDLWYQNACAVTATTAPDGVSIAVPAAP